jgi:hypothetical protein
MIAFLAVFLAGGSLGAFAVLVIGIHADEHRMSLKAKAPANSRAEAGTRRVLGVGVRTVHDPHGRISDRRDLRK